MSRVLTPDDVTPAHGLPAAPPEPRRDGTIVRSPVEAVGFTARCPACGEDVDWVEERRDTAVRVVFEGPCRRRKVAA